MYVWSPREGDILLSFLSSKGLGQPNSLGTATLVPAAFASVSSAGAVTESVSAAITAGTTHTLVGATPLTSQVNNVSVCANAADAVALPAASLAQIGNCILVANNGAAAAAVWPQAADKIDGGSAGAAVTLTNPKRCLFFCISVNNWISVVSAGASS